ncbi:MAG: hypothetical protein ACLR8Y_02385 [Alistipes indistinctus]
MALMIHWFQICREPARPDGSGNNSFLRGIPRRLLWLRRCCIRNTALRGARGTVSGYTIATCIGMTRQMNNKHWLSDMLMGAGIGILSTELGISWPT